MYELRHESENPIHSDKTTRYFLLLRTIIYARLLYVLDINGIVYHLSLWGISVIVINSVHDIVFKFEAYRMIYRIT
jgi:hypothetical protein